MRGSVGFFLHPRIDPLGAAVREGRRVLEGAGVRVWMADRETRQSTPKDAILMVTLGGDGTLLQGSLRAVARNLPLLGVNFGRLGFLTELESDDLVSGLQCFLAGDYRLEERTVLQVTRRRGLAVSRWLALNEAVVHRVEPEGLGRFELQVEGEEVGVIDADGLIVASATGSTAYARAAGGPVLDPTLNDIVVVPMNPFALTVRPIVLPAHQRLTIGLPATRASLALDGGRTRTLAVGDAVEITAYQNRLGMVRFTPPGRFYQQLRNKLGWGLPLVPTPGVTRPGA
ncbi:MAG TPA: NAD(+)/NADH kinase [Candidatus Acidoferrales bacterium]|nr:NAD(+)/NADH kinase [Candidatus Acidoferrales bacterium]